MAKRLIDEIANLIVAYKNSVASGNAEWRDRHMNAIEEIAREKLPSGSGIDGGTKIDVKASNVGTVHKGPEKIVLTAGYHHMDENGFYSGWTNHTITVSPSFDGLDIKISGPNKNDVKEYLGEVYYEALTQTV
jgi:hypothetical protein